MTINEDKKKIVYAIIILAIVLARFAISDRIGPLIFADATYDDQLMINSAMQLIKGNWLGQDYNQFVLLKGCFGPLFVAGSYFLGITYLHAYTLIYIFSCLLFVYAIRPIIKNYFSQVIALCIIMFNPLSFGFTTYQRIYRNGFSQWQMLILFASFFSIFYLRKFPIKKSISWEIVAGLIVWAMLNTREDGIWVYVFIIAATIATGIMLFIENDRRNFVLRTVILLIPFFMVFAGNTAIRLINYDHYGVYVLNERAEGEFPGFMACLYNIKPDEKDEEKYSSDEYEGYYINIYHSALEKAYDASPTLNSIKPEIEETIKSWSDSDGEVVMDHLLFAIRDAVKKAGYYEDGQATEEFYSVVAHELEEAFRNGTLEKRGIVLSGGCVPFNTEQLPKLFKEIRNAYQCILSFDDVVVTSERLSGNEDNVVIFENIIGYSVPRDGFGADKDNGWIYFAEDNKIKDYALNRANRCVNMYILIVKPLWIICHLTFVFFVIYDLLKKRTVNIEQVISVASILLTMLLVVAMVSHITATTFWATNSLYLNAAYILCLMFEAFCIGSVLDRFIVWLRGKYDSRVMSNNME